MAQECKNIRKEFSFLDDDILSAWELFSAEDLSEYNKKASVFFPITTILPFNMLRYTTSGQSPGLDVIRNEKLFYCKYTLTYSLKECCKYILNNNKINKTQISGTPHIHILKASNNIAMKTRRGVGNFIIGNKKLLEKFFGVDIPHSPFPIGRYNIMTTNYIDNNIIIGYTGGNKDSYMDSGLCILNDNRFYCPCVGNSGEENYYEVLYV